MTTRTITLDITGMSCANCSATIEDTLSEFDGVDDASANYATDEATIAYDATAVSLAELYDAIDDAGYEAVSETVRIGMDRDHRYVVCELRRHQRRGPRSTPRCH